MPYVFLISLFVCRSSTSSTLLVLSLSAQAASPSSRDRAVSLFTLCACSYALEIMRLLAAKVSQRSLQSEFQLCVCMPAGVQGAGYAKSVRPVRVQNGSTYYIYTALFRHEGCSGRPFLTLPSVSLAELWLHIYLVMPSMPTYRSSAPVKYVLVHRAHFLDHVICK